VDESRAGRDVRRGGRYVSNQIPPTVCVYKTDKIDTFSHHHPSHKGAAGLEKALDRVAKEASLAVADGVACLVLSDRAADTNRVAVSSLLCVGAVHHHLVSTMERTRVAVLVESAEARDVHHVCALTGFGADGVCPYLAVDAIARLKHDGLVPGHELVSLDDLIQNYFHALEHGMLKVFAKVRRLLYFPNPSRRLFAVTRLTLSFIYLRWESPLWRRTRARRFSKPLV